MGRRRKNKALPIQDIADGCMKALENAEDLVQEARLLLEAGHAPRAYGLSHLALEELAKISMLFRAGSQIQAGIEVDWARLYKRFRSHKHKWWSRAITEYALDEEADGHGDVERLFRSIGETGNRLTLKEAAFYVDLYEGFFVAPKERIDHSAAAALIESANAQVRFFRQTLPAVLKSYSEPLSDEMRNLVELVSSGSLSAEESVAVIELMRDALRAKRGDSDGQSDVDIGPDSGAGSAAG
jgi:AbiV family abortive infection protein